MPIVTSKSRLLRLVTDSLKQAEVDKTVAEEMKHHQAKVARQAVEFEDWRVTSALRHKQFWENNKRETAASDKLWQQIRQEVKAYANIVYTNKLDVFMQDILARSPNNCEKHHKVKALHAAFTQEKNTGKEVCHADYIERLELITYKHTETEGLLGLINLFRYPKSYNDLQDLKRACRAKVDAKEQNICKHYGY